MYQLCGAKILLYASISSWEFILTNISLGKITFSISPLNFIGCWYYWLPSLTASSSPRVSSGSGSTAAASVSLSFSLSLSEILSCSLSWLKGSDDTSESVDHLLLLRLLGDSDRDLLQSRLLPFLAPGPWSSCRPLSSSDSSVVTELAWGPIGSMTISLCPYRCSLCNPAGYALRPASPFLFRPYPDVLLDTLAFSNGTMHELTFAFPFGHNHITNILH